MWNIDISAGNQSSDAPDCWALAGLPQGLMRNRASPQPQTLPNHPVPLSQPTPFVVFHTKINTSASESLPHTVDFLIRTEVVVQTAVGRGPFSRW